MYVSLQTVSLCSHCAYADNIFTIMQSIIDGGMLLSLFLQMVVADTTCHHWQVF